MSRNDSTRAVALLRGRIGAIHPEYASVRVDVETDYGVITTVLARHDVERLHLVVGSHVMADMGAAQVVIAPG
ncbi:MAG: TOBE domain-containing protein [Pseudomonadota bacterium]